MAIRFSTGVKRTNETFKNGSATQAAMAAAMRGPAAAVVVGEFEKITANWKNNPKFVPKVKVTRNEVELQVKVDRRTKAGKIYSWVSGGTKPHKIKPKKPGGVLVFPWGGRGSYKAKTKPTGRFGGSGRVSPKATTVLKFVNHPGIEARNFERFVSKRSKKPVNAILRKAFTIGLNS